MPILRISVSVSRQSDAKSEPPGAIFRITACRNSCNRIHRDRLVPAIQHRQSMTRATMKNIHLFLITLLFGAAASALAGTEPTLQPAPTPASEEKNSRDLFD